MGKPGLQRWRQLHKQKWPQRLHLVCYTVIVLLWTYYGTLYYMFIL